MFKSIKTSTKILVLGFVMLWIIHLAGGEYYDRYYLQVIITFITSLFSVYFIYKVLEYTSPPHADIYQYFVGCVIGSIFFNNICALTSVLSPSLYNVIQSFQVVEVDALGIMSDALFQQRLRGLGENVLFNGGVISSLGLILCMYKMLKSSSKSLIFLYFVAYIFIMFSGILIARTTIVGVLLSLFLLSMHVNLSNVFKYVFWVLFSVLLVVIVFVSFIELLDPEMASWAFEFVFNYIDSGSVGMESTDELQDMWSIIPKDFMTYLIGDGLFRTPSGGYYKGVDVGYLRLIYYSGAFVMLALFWSLKQLLGVRLLGIRTDLDKLNLVLLCWVLIMNVKGICLPIAIIILFHYVQHHEAYRCKYVSADCE